MTNKSETAKAQHEMIGIKEQVKEFEPNQHPDAQWYYKKPGTLGLFIHFGISTVRAYGDLSWGMIKGKPWETKWGNDYCITPHEYWEQAKKFDPVNFDPDNWMKAIKAAGFEYAVFTTRHHDGFSMWPSQFGNFNTNNYMHGRDLVGEYIQAARKNDIKVGLYYSPPDWYWHRYYKSFYFGSGRAEYPERINLGLDFEPIGELPPIPEPLERDYIQYVNDQVRELLTRYGKIDLFWFDGSISDISKGITIEEMRKLQPGILVNDRMHGTGNFCTQYECFVPTEKPKYKYWESCHIWPDNCGWAWVDRCTGYRSAERMYNLYKPIRDMGGNFLMNVAPRTDGTLSPDFYDRLKDFKEILDKEGK
jgi:alpha-L-fucosidase